MKSKGVLSDYRILSFGWVAAAPYIASMLGDMGAEVIKLETRDPIDILRLSPDNLARDPDRDPWFHSAVRNQLSVTLNLNHPKAIPIVKDIVKVSDVILENFSPEFLPRKGLGYESLKEINPKIIMISLSGMGQDGPLFNTRVVGPCLTAYGGIDALVGYPGERILGLQQAYADFNAALHGAFAVLAALYFREKTGKGQYIDLSELECVISTIPEIIMEYVMNSRVFGTIGNYDGVMAPHGNYRCKGEDSWVSIAIKTEEEWKAFCTVIGDPALANDKRFNDGYRRQKNKEEIDKIVNDWTTQYSAYEATDLLQAAGVAATPLLDTEGRFFDSHLKERQIYLEVEHPLTGMDWVAGFPWKLSETPGAIYSPSPALGEHNEYVLKELLGLSEEEITQLIGERVVC